MRKKQLIMLILGIIIVILIIIFFPKYECGQLSSMEPSSGLKCTCLGIKSYDVLLGGSRVFCKGICLKNTCEEEVSYSLRADAHTPLMFEVYQLVIEKGNKASYLASVYNSGMFKDDVDVRLEVTTCTDYQGENITGFNLLSVGQKIPVNSSGTYRFIVSADDSVSKGTYICAINATDGNEYISHKIFLQVK